MNSKLLTPADRRFLRRSLRYFNVKMVKLEWSPSLLKHPDIWIKMNGNMPQITVTAEWARQPAQARMTRIVHELIHTCGIEHNDKVNFSTFPDKDEFSKKVFGDIVSGTQKFDRRRFGL